MKNTTKIISLYSGKGGVGKTVLAKEIALGLSKIGNKVLLIDGDLEFGNIFCLFSDLEEKKDKNLSKWKKDIDKKINALMINEMCNNSDKYYKITSKIEINTEAYREKKSNFYKQLVFEKEEIEKEYLIKEQESGLYLLFGLNNYMEEVLISREDILTIINDLKKCDFDYIIIDLPNKNDDKTYEFLEESDFILTPITLDLLSLTSFNRLFTMFKNIDFSIDKFKFILNKFNANQKNSININDIEKTFSIPVIYKFSEFKDLNELYNNYKSLVLSEDEKFEKYKQEILNFCKYISKF